MAAILGFDELNKPEFDSEAYIKEYFKPMRISEERKEEREEAAHSFLDVLLFILTLISMENEFNALDWAYIEAQFQKELKNAALQYARESKALDDYISEKAEEFIRVTQSKDLSDPYWTSEERATMEAVNEANDVVGYEEWQKAIDEGYEYKIWRTERDTKVRRSHQAVEGKKLPIKDMFEVGNGLMRYPHDWYYNPDECYNCRCALDFADKTGKVTKTGQKVQFTTVKNSDSIKLRAVDGGNNAKEYNSWIEDRNVDNGMRRSVFYTLTDEDIINLQNEAEKLEIPKDVLVFNKGSRTGFFDLDQKIRVRGDVFPNQYGNTARSRMSPRAVLAHEYYGHFKNHPSPYPINDWRDEYYASRNAALNAPNLTDEERRDLMIDAYDRQKEAGVFEGYDDIAKEMIYGIKSD